MVITLSPSTPRAYEFACNSAACRPPTSGGTGGSLKSGGGSGKSGDHDRNQRGWAARKASPPSGRAEPSLPSIRNELRAHRGLKSESSTPEGRRTVMNDLIKRSKVQSAKNLAAAKARGGVSATNTGPTGTPYRNSGSIADQVARGQHLAKQGAGAAIRKRMAEEDAANEWIKTVPLKNAANKSVTISPKGVSRGGHVGPVGRGAVPENFPRGDKRKGPAHSETIISGQQKNSPWNLTMTRGRGKTQHGKGRPVTKDGGFYGAKLIKPKSRDEINKKWLEDALGRQAKAKELGQFGHPNSPAGKRRALLERHAAKMVESQIQKAQSIKAYKKAQKDQGTEFPSLGK